MDLPSTTTTTTTTIFFASICVQRAQRFHHCYAHLTLLHRLRALVFQDFATAGWLLTQAMTSPRWSSEPPPRRRLLVVRFLETHLAEDGIERQSFDMLYRLIMIISAAGREMHGVAQATVARISVVRQVEWYASCILEGCEMLRQYCEEQLNDAQTAANGLPDLEKVADEQLGIAVQKWRDVLRTLHIPSRNDVRLFEHLSAHYGDSLYYDFLQLMRNKPHSAASILRGKLDAIQQTLLSLCDACRAAILVVEDLEKEIEGAAKRLRRWGRSQVIITASPVGAQHIVDQVPIREAEYHPLLNQQPAEEAVTEEAPQLSQANFQPNNSGSGDREHSGQPTQHAAMNKFFSTIEEQVTHRRHARTATPADPFLADTPSGDFAPNLAQPRARHSFRGSSIGARRRGSASNVPRTFTSSFSELESDITRLQLHTVQTPERQPSWTTLRSSSPVEPRIRDFADTPAMCPSPVTLLQRQAALVCRDAQWEDRVVNGEVVRSRRPLDRSLQRAQTIDDRTGGLEAWLERQQSSAEESLPTAPSSGAKRGLLRQRENTI